MAYGDGDYGAGGYGLDGFQPVVPVTDGPDGSLVLNPGQLQYGPMLLGAGSPAGWRELIGWRDLPEAEVADSPRPQAHGTYPGDVHGGSLAVTFTYLVRGTPDAKTAALATIERYTPMDGVDRALVVDDGDGPELRMARVIGRQVPQDRNYRHGPVECSVQFLCADPRRYALTPSVSTVSLPVSEGGLEYPLSYPSEYGTATAGGAIATNAGGMPTPVVVTFHGPLTDPVLIADTWASGFNLNLADGESLTVDTAAGTVLLNGSADRLYTIRNDASPLERCLLPPGTTNLTLIAAAGTGSATVTFRDARM